MAYTSAIPARTSLRVQYGCGPVHPNMMLYPVHTMNSTPLQYRVTAAGCSTPKSLPTVLIWYCGGYTRHFTTCLPAYDRFAAEGATLPLAAWPWQARVTRKANASATHWHAADWLAGPTPDGTGSVVHHAASSSCCSGCSPWAGGSFCPLAGWNTAWLGPHGTDVRFASWSDSPPHPVKACDVVMTRP